MPVTHALRRLRDDIEAYMGNYIKVIAPLFVGPKKQRPTEKQEKTERKNRGPVSEWVGDL